jgi:hypothetical protein
MVFLFFCFCFSFCLLFQVMAVSHTVTACVAAVSCTLKSAVHFQSSRLGYTFPDSAKPKFYLAMPGHDTPKLLIFKLPVMCFTWQYMTAISR